VPTSSLQRQPPPPLAVIVEGQEEYGVAAIHGKKQSRNRDLYLVEWVGYPNKADWTWEPQTNLTNAGEILTAFEKWMINKSSRTTTIRGGYCYDHVTPHDGNAHSFSKEQMRDGASALKGSAQGRPIIEQVANKCQSNLLPRQQDNESSRQAQTLKEWEVQRPREGGVQSKNCQAPTTADRHHAAEKTAD
jgi:hypothetical protein